jgi:ectoine hydroxylase-related dioxygenase (phytanoyl-CoA dioxygenase family)
LRLSIELNGFEMPDYSSYLKQFQEEGYAIFPDVLDQDLIEETRGHIEWLQKRHPDLRPEHLGHTLVKDDPFWVRLISDDRLLDVAEAFIGPNIALFASHYIAKPAGDGQPVLWHQDGHYWPLQPMEVVTLWLAADDADAENGCMRVLPGTHKAKTLYDHERHTETANVLSSRIDSNAYDDSAAVDIAMKAGGVSVHDPFIVHGSNANRSNRRRAGLTIRYIPTSTTILVEGTDGDSGANEKGVFPSAFLLRGEDKDGSNRYQPRPIYREGDHYPFRGCEAWR